MIALITEPKVGTYLTFNFKLLNAILNKLELNVNVNKTEYLVVDSDTRFEVLIKYSTSIEQIDEFKYLGALITREGLAIPEIKKTNRTEQESSRKLELYLVGQTYFETHKDSYRKSFC